MLETWIPGVKRGSVPAFLVKGGHSSHVPLHCNNWNFASSAIKFSPHHTRSRGGGLTLLQCSSNAMFVSNKTIFLSDWTSERRRHSIVNNMGAIQVWLRNNSVLAFWICFEYDNEHSDVWRVTCYNDPETIFLFISIDQHQHSCVPMIQLRKYFRRNKVNHKFRTKADQGWIWLHHYCQYK